MRPFVRQTIKGKEDMLVMIRMISLRYYVPQSTFFVHSNLLCPVDVDLQPQQTLPDIQSKNFAISFLKNVSESQG